MKIRCDVCNKDAASVFCTADEAALCTTCDHRVHDANKLASTHQRLSLLHPSSSKESLSAMSARDCDVPIHTANEHTKKHNRFLLTGVKLSSLSSLSNPSLSSSSSACLTCTNDDDSSVPGSKSHQLIKKQTANQPSSAKPSGGKSQINGNTMLLNKTTTTISEYLMEMLPGWQVEDFLDSFGFCQYDDVVPPHIDVDVEMTSKRGSFQSENLGVWVPQAPQTPINPNQIPSQDSELIGILKEATAPNLKLGNSNKRWFDDGGFTVPQISPPSIAAKKYRSFWF